MPDGLLLRLQGLLEDFSARTEQLARLQERVGALLGAEVGLAEDLTVDGVLGRLAVSARDLLGAQGAVVRLLGPVWASPSMTAADGARAVPTPDPAPADDPPGPGAPSVLSAPLRAHGTVLGELVLSAEDGSFAAEDEEVLAVLAAAAGPAIWNAVLYEEGQRRQRWLEALLDAAGELVSGEDLALGRGLELVAERGLRASESALAMVLVPDSGRLRIGAAAGALPSPPLLAVPEARAGAELADGALVGDPAQWLGDEAADGLGQALAVPLGVGGPGCMLLLLAKRRGQAYSPADISSAALFGAHAGLALRLRAAARDRAREALSSDRRRIARDLHDLVIQRLFAAGLSLQRIPALIRGPGAEAWTAQIVGELDAAIQELREAVDALGSRAAESEPDSFSAILVETVRRALGHTGRAVRITIDGPAETIPAPAADRLIDLVAAVLSNADGARLGPGIALTITVREEDVELSIDEHAGLGSTGLVRSADRLGELLPGLGTSTRTTDDDGARLTWAIPLRPPSS